MNFRLMFLCFTIFVVSARKPLPDHTDDPFQKDCLTASNNYRKIHHAPPFRIDAKAVTYAKSRCQLISQKEGLNHGHAGLKLYGENLYFGKSSKLETCTDAIKKWYSEVGKYKYNNPVLSTATKYFTQLVWKASTRLGCARCGGRGSKVFETYVVCNYLPPGNVLNQFKANVLRP